jgi:hypothetical protein
MGLEPTTFCMASRRSSQLSYIRASADYSPGRSPPSRAPHHDWSRRTGRVGGA